MKRTSKLLVVAVLAALGAWGCAKGPANGGPQAERIHSLEAKVAKLEGDYRDAATARDDARKAAASLEQERNKLQTLVNDLRGQLTKDRAAVAQLTTERDDLKRQVEKSTTERDSLQLRCEKMKKGLQSLLGQDDAMINAAQQPPPVGSTLGEGSED